MNSKIIPFNMGHMNYFEHDDKSSVIKNVAGFMQYNKVKIYTVVYDDNPIAIFYTNELEAGVVLVWATMCKNVRRYSIGIHKAAKLGLLMLQEMGYLKIQALVDHDFPIGRNWLFSLGFEEEGLLKKYGMWNKDRYLYGRVLWQHL